MTRRRPLWSWSGPRHTTTAENRTNGHNSQNKQGSLTVYQHGPQTVLRWLKPCWKWCGAGWSKWSRRAMRVLGPRNSEGAGGCGLGHDPDWVLSWVVPVLPTPASSNPFRGRGVSPKIYLRFPGGSVGGSGLVQGSKFDTEILKLKTMMECAHLYICNILILS